MKTKAAKELIAKLDAELKKYCGYAANSASDYVNTDDKLHKINYQKYSAQADLLRGMRKEVVTALHCVEVEVESYVPRNKIVLPREMDEDLWYIVGGSMGAASPEQCERAKPLWAKLVERADRDAEKNPING